MRTLPSLVALSLLLSLTHGCGLVEDLLAFTIDTDWKYFTLDTAQLGVTVPGGASTIPAINCTKDANCAALKCGGSGYSCATKCLNKKCGIVAIFEQGTTIDLSQKITNSTTATILSKVTLDKVSYDATVNSLNFNTPKLNMYIGPNSAKNTSSSGVAHFAEMPVIPAKQTPKEDMNVTAQGKTALEQRVLDYKNPFKMFGKASLTFTSGSPIPQGKLRLGVKAYFMIDPLK